MNESAALLLGAGFSYTAGVPLAKDLFRQNYVLGISENSKRRFDGVLAAYDEWRDVHQEGHAEQFMDDLYRQHLSYVAPIWNWAVEYVGAVIASAGTPPPVAQPQSTIFKSYQSARNYGRAPSVLGDDTWQMLRYRSRNDKLRHSRGAGLAAQAFQASASAWVLLRRI